MNPGFIKSFVAEAAIGPYHIVKHGSADANVLQATAVTESLLGVTGQVQGDAGKRVDVIMSDTAEVEYGGTITRGDYLTSDANGHAVTAAPAAGVNNNVIGRAMCSGVVGDIGSVLLSISRIQG